MRTALVAVQIAGVGAGVGVQILLSQGQISQDEANKAQKILGELSADTQCALNAADSVDDETSCYSAIAKCYTPVLDEIPGVPPGTAAQVNIVIDLLDSALRLVGVTPPPRSADHSLSHASTLACLEGEVQS